MNCFVQSRSFSADSKEQSLFKRWQSNPAGCCLRGLGRTSCGNAASAITRPSADNRSELCSIPEVVRIIAEHGSPPPRRRVFGNADHSGADRTLDRVGAAQE